MTAKVENGELIIRIKVNELLAESGSGKSLVVASTYGNKVIPDCQVNGKPVTIGLNCYIPKK
jgi:ABC-type dipeptide/oligopeptide/nickel transport system ATPase component